MKRIRNVCIFGGTHGNEPSGVQLLRKWGKTPDEIRRPSFNTHTCLANPEAVKLNRRYKDCDLNRQFLLETLAAEVTPSTPYEVRRAKEIKSMLQEGGKIGPCDFVLDLHNTTSNMKACLMYADSNPSALVSHMIRYISEKLPPGTCYGYGVQPYGHTRSLAPHGIGIEIGPQPQGVLRGDMFLLQEKVVGHALDFIEKYNTGAEFPAGKVTGYRYITKIPYPRDEKGEIVAMVHPDLQDKDWIPLVPSSPVFLHLNGAETTLKDVYPECSTHSEPVYPVFINEGAYYEKDGAFMLVRKFDRELPPLKCK